MVHSCTFQTAKRDIYGCHQLLLCLTTQITLLSADHGLIIVSKCYFKLQVKDFRGFVREAIGKVLNISDSALDTQLPRAYVYDEYIADNV